jgi:hypothetical protein
MIPIKGNLKRSEYGYIIPYDIHKNQGVELKIIDIQDEEYTEDFTGEVTLVNDRDSINKNYYTILEIIPNEHDGIITVTSRGVVRHHPEGTGVDGSYPNTRIGNIKRLKKK